MTLQVAVADFKAFPTGESAATCRIGKIGALLDAFSAGHDRHASPRGGANRPAIHNP